MIQKPPELLEKLMTGYEMTSSDLDDLLRDKTPEGLFLEYKDGKELEKPRSERNGTIREYLSAFANSAGGILIIGVDENTWTVTGCPAPGGGDLAEWEKKSRSNLAEWAARCVTPIAHHFSPRPRYQTLDHPDGQVLIMVTERSPNLIPCNVGGEFVYYLRHHDQTLRNEN